MNKKELVEFLSETLKISDFCADTSMNGVQIDSPVTEVTKVAFAVDASVYSIREAVRCGAQMLFVHHGLFWGRPIAISGSHRDRVEAAISGNLVLFACHIPLDAHPTLGHNAQIAKILGVTSPSPFGVWRGMPLGYSGLVKEPLTVEEIASRLGATAQSGLFIVPAGPEKAQRIAIVSGGAPECVEDAYRSGCDTYITGEKGQAWVLFARENHINMICAGHYQTEIFGLKAVSELLSEKGLETVFIDNPTGV